LRWIHGSINFWTCDFYCLFCLSSKCNLSEAVYQVRALHRWGGKQS